MIKKVLILGGAGYLGQGIAELFIKKNIKVLILDRFFYLEKKYLIKNKLIKYIKDDARKLKDGLFKGVDMTFDLTNVSIAPKNNKFYDKMSWEINYESRIKNLELSKKNTLEEAISMIKPPIFWKDKTNFITQAKKWSLSKIKEVQSTTYGLEIEIKSNSVINKTILMKKLLVDICKKSNA